MVGVRERERAGFVIHGVDSKAIQKLVLFLGFVSRAVAPAAVVYFQLQSDETKQKLFITQIW